MQVLCYFQENYAVPFNFHIISIISASYLSGSFCQCLGWNIVWWSNIIPQEFLASPQSMPYRFLCNFVKTCKIAVELHWSSDWKMTQGSWSQTCRIAWFALKPPTFLKTLDSVTGYCQESLPGESIYLRVKKRCRPRFGHSDVVFAYFY